MDSNGLTPGRIPRNQLQMTSVLAEGRFAVVRKAQLDSGKEKSVVAAKALRSKFLVTLCFSLISVHLFFFWFVRALCTIFYLYFICIVFYLYVSCNSVRMSH